MPRTPVLLALLTAALPGCGGGDAVELNGQGATFVEPVMKFWTNEYLDRTGGRVRINYQGTGSGAGLAQTARRLADFGCTDAPMTRRQLAAAGGAVVHVPLVAGAVVPVYHVPGLDRPLAFTGPLLADIFLGKVTAWDDPRVRALNPAAPLPALAIQPVYRADPSGTSFIASDYLCKVSDEFRRAVGTSTTPDWPAKVGVRQPRSDGVAGHVRRTPGAIGYLELTYALDTKAPFGAVVNRAGRPVLASLGAITAAAEASLGVPQTAEPYSLHDLTYNLTDAPGEASYPIAGMSFAVMYADQEGPKGRALVEFLAWVTSDEGQTMAERRNFAPLPPALREKIRARLDALIRP